MSSFNLPAESTQNGPLAVSVISPDRRRRIAAMTALLQSGSIRIHEISEYPFSFDDLPRLLHADPDAILIDIDGDPNFALELVEKLCVDRNCIVMVYSAHADPDLMLRSMRAGAREFFTIPFNESAVKRAILWVGTQRQHVPSAPKTNGRQLVFLGSKGGVGVTTIASNFAVALAEESKKSVLLVDLNLHLGDAAMNLGLEAAYSTLDALDNSFQLDAFLFSNFLVRHASGLSVLAAPIDVPATTATPVGIGRLLALARQQFDYVVVDGGKKIDLKQMQMFDETTTAYLITQVGIPELRNANRLIAQFQGERSPALEIVINRYQPRFLGLTDEQLAKALTRPIRWRVPNDYAAVCEMQNTGVPLLQTSSSIAGVIRQMARAAGGVADIGKASSRGTISRGIRLPWKANPAA